MHGVLTPCYYDNLARGGGGVLKESLRGGRWLKDSSAALGYRVIRSKRPNNILTYFGLNSFYMLCMHTVSVHRLGSFDPRESPQEVENFSGCT